jgi:hypothetical protein
MSRLQTERPQRNPTGGGGSEFPSIGLGKLVVEGLKASDKDKTNNSDRKVQNESGASPELPVAHHTGAGLKYVWGLLVHEITAVLPGLNSIAHRGAIFHANCLATGTRCVYNVTGHAIPSCSERMTVALQLRLEAARLLREEMSSTRRPTAASTERASVRRVLALIRDARASVTAVHPRATDPVLSTFFSIDAPDAERAARLASDLLKLPIVEAAYVKPPDEPPT